MEGAESPAPMRRRRSRRRRKQPLAQRLVRPGLLLLLGVASVLFGVAAGRFSASTITPQGLPIQSPFDTPEPRMKTIADLDPQALTDTEADRGRSWAGLAFPAGLRQCPDPTPAFLAACNAEMAARAQAVGQLKSDRWGSWANGQEDAQPADDGSDGFAPPPEPRRAVIVTVRPPPPIVRPPIVTTSQVAPDAGDRNGAMTTAQPTVLPGGAPSGSPTAPVDVGTAQQ